MAELTYVSTTARLQQHKCSTLAGKLLWKLSRQSLIIMLAAICMAESANLAGDALLRNPVWQQCAALKLSTQS